MMSSKTLDPIKEYRSKQFRSLPIVDLAASCCPSLDNLSCMAATPTYQRMDDPSCAADNEKASAVTRLHKVNGAKSVMKCVLRTLSPVSICGRMGRACRVDDLVAGDSFYEMVLGPEDQPREVCRLANARYLQYFDDKHENSDASPRSDESGVSSFSKHASELFNSSPERQSSPASPRVSAASPARASAVSPARVSAVSSVMVLEHETIK